MAIINPDAMKPEIKRAFSGFLAAWGIDINEIGELDTIHLIKCYYLDQMLALKAAGSGYGKIISPPGGLRV